MAIGMDPYSLQQYMEAMHRQMKEKQERERYEMIRAMQAPTPGVPWPEEEQKKTQQAAPKKGAAHLNPKLLLTKG